MLQPIGIYIHWPFCKSKCPYCDFNSHVRERIDEAAWQIAYLKALGHYAELTKGREVVSVFFGGGTPSLMPAATVEAIINDIHRLWSVAGDVEITLEANPTSVEADKFKAFRAAGVNRVSLGVQAMDDAQLKFLGREHSVADAMRAVDIARATFDRYSFDLMYARPDQTLKSWQQELENAFKYVDGHMSLYQLTIERNTPFYFDEAQGKFSMPDENVASDFYSLTQDILEGQGLPAYEVSNHAKPGQESRHNLIYWHYGDYIGIGPGAHGRLSLEQGKVATREHAAPEIWLERVMEGGSAAHPFEPLSPRDQFTESLMMGLRLREGLSLKRLEERCGVTWGDMIDLSKLKALQEQGWAVFDDHFAQGSNQDRLQLTVEGWLRLNAILPYILKSA